jgi:hypothetical protein
MLQRVQKRSVSSILSLEEQAKLFMAVDGLTQQMPTCRRSLRKRAACHPNHEWFVIIVFEEHTLYQRTFEDSFETAAAAPLAVAAPQLL